jgi:hypothetical protein
MKIHISVASTVAVVALLLTSAPLLAHHSLTAEFDTEKTVQVQGTITEMKWTNPHGWLYVNVKDDKGQTKLWAVEFASPNQLYRRGWTKADLPAGAQVTITGYPSRDNGPRVSATDVKLQDGRTLFAGMQQGGKE